MENQLHNNKPENKDNTGKRILLFDDNLEILNLCRIILKKMHYEVMTKPRCENVIEDVLGFKPHLILMDLWIPTIGGEKAVELLKADPVTSNIPVFLFSANPDIREICKRVNAEGYLTKPFNLFSFKDTIDKHINSSEAARTSQEQQNTREGL